MANRPGPLEGVGVTPGFWRGRRVLLTGHTGFKGAWLALWLRRLGAEVTGLALAAEPESLAARLPALPGSAVDLNDRAAVEAAVVAARPEVVLHLAAQALVRRGYADPVATYATNLMGTAHLLAALDRAPDLKAVVIATTDKVYANKEDGRRFVESDPLGGHDPYSASKACTEILAASWRGSFLAARGVGLATGRAGNVIGGGDRGQDRLVPDFFRALESNRPLRIRNPNSVRPWQFVLEPLEGYLRLAEAVAADSAGAPEAVNFGPHAGGAVPVRALIETLIRATGAGSWEPDGEPGPHEAGLLELESAFAEQRLGWRPRLDLPTALAWTAQWWRDARAGAAPEALCLAQIARFEELAAA